MVVPLPDFSWNAPEIIEGIATLVGYALLVLGAGIALCAFIGILLRGLSRLVDWVHERRIHGWNGNRGKRGRVR